MQISGVGFSWIYRIVVSAVVLLCAGNAYSTPGMRGRASVQERVEAAANQRAAANVREGFARAFDQCSPSLRQWMRQTDSGLSSQSLLSFTFIGSIFIADIAAENIESCQKNYVSTRDFRTAAELNASLETGPIGQRLSTNLNNHLKSCNFANEEQNKRAIAKYYYAQSRLESEMQSIVEEMLSQNEYAKHIFDIEQGKGSDADLGLKCRGDFVQLVRYCTGASRRCGEDSLARYNEYLDQLQKDYSEILDIYSEITKIKSTAWQGGGGGAVLALSAEKKKQIEFLNFQADLLKARHPVLEGDAFNSVMSKHAMLPRDRRIAAVPEALRIQLIADRKALISRQKQVERVSKCLSNQSNVKCTPNEINQIVEKAAPRIEGPGMNSMDRMRMEGQSCVESALQDRDQTAKVLGEAGVTAATVVVGGPLVGGVRAAAASARMNRVVLNYGRGVVAGAVFSGEALVLGNEVSKAAQECEKEAESLPVAEEVKSCPAGHIHLSKKNDLWMSCVVRKVGVAAGLSTVPGLLVIRNLFRVDTAATAIRTSQAVDPRDAIADLSLERRGTSIPSRDTFSPSAVRVQRTAQRQSLIDDYLRKDFTSVESRQAWVRVASKVQPDGKTKFVDVQNAAIKQLNDTTLDKDFVTALTNKHIEMTMASVDSVLKRYPGVEAIPYTDFKSTRYAFSPKPPATQLPAAFEREMAAALRQVNSDFTDFMRKNNLIRQTDRPEDWFRYGWGETGDQANLASRYGRHQSDNRMYSFSDGEVRTQMQRSLREAESMRQSLITDFSGTRMLDTSAGRKSLSADVFELVRKSESPAELRSQVSRVLQTDISLQQAERIMAYSGRVDEFSPGIHIVRRESASLADAQHGGIALDFKGMGANNLKETAEALALSPGNLQNSIEYARLGESAVTEQFARNRERIRAAIEGVAQRRGMQFDIRVSGDDMVVIPNAPITSVVRDEITRAIARESSPSAIRMSSIPPGVASTERAGLAVRGESIEKTLRSSLYGQIPNSRLDQILFRIDMNQPPGQIWNAQLNYHVSGSILNADERRAVEAAFRRAVELARQAAQP